MFGTAFIKISALFIIVIDLFAIIDIVKGQKPDLNAEYTTLIFSSIIFVVLYHRYRHRKKI